MSFIYSFKVLIILCSTIPTMSYYCHIVILKTSEREKVKDWIETSDMRLKSGWYVCDDYKKDDNIVKLVEEFPDVEFSIFFYNNSRYAYTTFSEGEFDESTEFEPTRIQKKLIDLLNEQHTLYSGKDTEDLRYKLEIVRHMIIKNEIKTYKTMEDVTLHIRENIPIVIESENSESDDSDDSETEVRHIFKRRDPVSNFIKKYISDDPKPSIRSNLIKVCSDHLDDVTVSIGKTCSIEEFKDEVLGKVSMDTIQDSIKFFSKYEHEVEYDNKMITEFIKIMYPLFIDKINEMYNKFVSE